jgi:hypothetical protein
MRRLEAFSGVRVLTYALMSNDFHLLSEVPQARDLSEAELLDRIQAGYSWKEVGRQYRKYLFVHGSLNTKTKRPAFDLATTQTVVDQQNGELSLPERLRCRIRYFTDGVILGSHAFVESHFHKLKHKLGCRRRRPATRLTVLGAADPFWVFRNLRVRTIG